MIKISKQTVNRIFNKPSAELDLHGLTKKEADLELDSFLIRAEQLGWQTVRIITGKGWNSVDGKGVLKNHISEKLKQYGYSFTNAKMNEGGEGVLVVKLY